MKPAISNQWSVVSNRQTAVCGFPAVARRLAKAGLLFAVFVYSGAHAQVPQIINYQGRISVNGTNFTGTGQFKFALVNASGATRYWSNGVNTVSLSVTKGLYAVLLGDTSIANMTTSIPPTVFTNSDVRLRVWFNSGSGLQQLSPDQRVAAVGYALMAASVDPASDVRGRRLNVGMDHQLTGDLATIAGGTNNTASATGASVGGGMVNVASGFMSTTAGGLGNQSQGWYSAVGGGWANFATAEYVVIAGGQVNQATNQNATVGGGINNKAYGLSATIGGGDSNYATNEYTTVAGGLRNSAGGWAATIGGGRDNTATNSYATVGGGETNDARGYKSTIGGGEENITDGDNATVGGGDHNLASGNRSTVAGGWHNSATNSYASVPGGGYNVAGGQFSHAAGRRAKAIHDGTFVWGDSTDADIVSSADNQFVVRARGGVQLNDPQTSLYFGNTTRQMLNLYGTSYGIGVQDYVIYQRTDPNGSFTWFKGGSHTNAYLNPGPGGTLLMRLDNSGNLYTLGSVNPPSDRNLKEEFQPLDVRQVLDKVATLPVTSWRYKTSSGERHIGPVAQEFHAAFGVGTDDKHIATVDADGVALAAIKGLYELVREKDAAIADLQRRLTELERKLAEGGK